MMIDTDKMNVMNINDLEKLKKPVISATCGGEFNVLITSNAKLWIRKRKGQYLLRESCEIGDPEIANAC